MKRAFAPVVPCSPEQPKAAVRELFDQNGGIDRVALKLGLQPPYVYSCAHPGTKDEISFARVAALTGPDAAAAVEFLAGLAGGAFVPMPRADSEVGALTAEAVRQSGEAAAQLVQSLLDGKLSRAEARRALPDLAEALQAFARLNTTVAAIARGQDDD